MSNVAMCFIAFVQIKLVNRSRLVLVQDIPEEHWNNLISILGTASVFIYRCVTERFPGEYGRLQCGKIPYVSGNRVQIKILRADHIFPEYLLKR